MRISVHAKPGAREEKIEKISDTEFVVSVKEPPVDGRANRAIVEALASYFRIPKNLVSIVVGHTSRNKIIDIAKVL